MDKRVQFHPDERADMDDMNALADLPDATLRKIARLVGEPRTDASDAAAVHGCVINGSSVTFDGADAVVGAGLEVVLASRVGQVDEAPYGEVYELEADVTIAGGATTALVTAKVVMARVGAEVDSDQEDRIEYDAGAGSKQKTVPLFTRKSRPLADWQAIAATDSAAIAAAQADGYQKVALLGWDGAAPQFTSWYSVFPTITNAGLHPGGALRSVVQGLAAMASALGRIIGSSGNAGKWDDNLATTTYGNPASLFWLNGAVSALKILADDYESRIAALEGEAVDLDSRVTALEDTTKAVGCVTATKQIIAGASTEAMEFDGANTFGPDSMHDPAGTDTDVVIPEDGIYMLTAACLLYMGTDADSGVAYLRIMEKAGATFASDSFVVKPGLITADYHTFYLKCTAVQYLTAGTIVQAAIQNAVLDATPDPWNIRSEGDIDGRFEVVKIR